MMALLVLLQSLALFIALHFSNVFFMLDTDAVRMFNGTTNTRMHSFNNDIGQLVSNMADELKILNDELLFLTQTAQINPQEIFMDDDIYIEAALKGSNTLIRLLQQNSITGAFLIFEGSNSRKWEKQAHSSVYIRNPAPTRIMTDPSSYMLEVGPTAITIQYEMPTSSQWKLDLLFDDDSDFYNKPLEAAREYDKSELTRYGYWSAPRTIFNDNQQIVCYTLPLLTSRGQVYGVLGIEISILHFTQQYLPNTDLPYQTSFYSIASKEKDYLSLEWHIPSGPLAQVYLPPGKNLPLKLVDGNILYSTHLEGLGDMYCSIQPLKMYSANSPFANEKWMLVGFVPKNILHEGTAKVRQTLILSILATTAISFGLIFLIAYGATRKISSLSKYIKTLSPLQELHFKPTGLREIDELTAALTQLNKSVIHATAATSKMLELTLLPVGGFEVSSGQNTVILTEYVYMLLDIVPGTQITTDQWAKHYAQLSANPSPDHADIYRYIDPKTGETRWLRMRIASTPTGMVGTILNITQEIEENLRLIHQLDYDALTQLYNRTAFKREVKAKIESEPNKIGAMIFSDLDNLKYINDTFGHDVGDGLIIRAGEMFNTFNLYNGIVSRISGDEFAIYLHGFSTKDQARELIRKHLRESEDCTFTTPQGSRLPIRYSSGLAWYPSNADNFPDLLKLSDYAMYEAKHNERGAIFEFNEKTYKQNVYLLENREALHRLLDEGLIQFAYQPIVDLHTGQLYAYEALMRPLIDTFHSPLEVLSVAATQSKLGQLERLIMFAVFEAIEENSQFLQNVRIFINSIPSYMMSKDDWYKLNDKYQHLFEKVVIEVTEAENNQPIQMKRKMELFKSKGMQLALDDFGSGYSNEMRILSIEPDIIKVDMGMVQGIHQNPDKQKLMANLVSFCQPKGIRIVAEGVENNLDMIKLIQLNVDFIQGYYISKPEFEFPTIPQTLANEILEHQYLRYK